MTLESLEARIESLEKHGDDREARIRFLEKAIWWGAGVCVGFGSLLTLIAPKIIKALGLGA